MYAIVQFLLSIILLYFNYENKDLIENGYLVGGITVLVLYFIFGKFLVKFYGNKE